jgi:hypothetical protein
MVTRNAAERSEIGALGAHTRWATVADRTAATAPGRAALRARFDAELDPAVTDPDLRYSMVSHAISAWMIREKRTRRHQAADIAATLSQTEPDND